MEPAVVAAFSAQIDYAAIDHKTAQEIARRRRQVVYVVVDADGPAHDRRFTCAAVIDGAEAGTGSAAPRRKP